MNLNKFFNIYIYIILNNKKFLVLNNFYFKTNKVVFIINLYKKMSSHFDRGFYSPKQAPPLY